MRLCIIIFVQIADYELQLERLLGLQAQEEMLDPEEYQLVMEEAGFEDAEVRSLEARGEESRCKGEESRGKGGGTSRQGGEEPRGKGEEPRGKGRSLEARGEESRI